MKKLRFYSSSILLYLLPLAALAQGGQQEDYGRLGLNEFGEYTNLGTNIPLIQTVASIINFLLGFLGVIAVVLVLWAGFKWMTAAGDEQQISTAKKILAGGVIGLAIVLVAYAITAFVIDQLLEATQFKDYGTP